MSRTTLQAAGRRGFILDYLHGGERTVDEVVAAWTQRSHRSTWRYVTIDTIQRDLNTMIRQSQVIQYRRMEPNNRPWRAPTRYVTYGLVSEPRPATGCDRPCPHCSLAGQP
jgi:hypothetical protein